jgi:hypothetical protein
MICYLTMMYFLEVNKPFMVVSSLFMVPQIVRNYQRGTRCVFLKKYVFGVMGTNILYPLYFRGWLHNFRGLEPSYEFCLVLLISYNIQIALLYMQDRYGPRCLIPGRRLNFIYYDCDEGNECVICLRELERGVMETPCRHRFHDVCLKSWMDVKLECPTCRAVLPHKWINIFLISD